MEKQNSTWGSFVSARIAPAVAGIVVERVFSNDLVSGLSTTIGLTEQDIRSTLIFLAIVALTNPMIYVQLLAKAIVAVRRFLCTAKHEVEGALTQPIEEDEKK